MTNQMVRTLQIISIYFEGTQSRNFCGSEKRISELYVESLINLFH